MKNAWALHASVSALLFALFTVFFAVAVGGSLPNPGDGVVGVFVAIFLVTLVLYAVVFALCAMALELAVSTAILLLSRPFGPGRVYGAHAVASIVVTVLVLNGGTIQRAIGRLTEGPARPTAITLYGDRLAIVHIESEEAGEVWVNAEAWEDMRSRIWSGTNQVPLAAGGGDVLVLLRTEVGATPTSVVVRSAMTDTEEARREFPFADIEQATAEGMEPTAIDVLDYDEAVARAWLRTLPVSVCRRVATPGEEVTVAVTLEVSREWSFPTPRAERQGADTPAAECVEHLVGDYGWAMPPEGHEGKVTVTYGM